jgi:acyl phosphate:glycerol-3-phosphate acyltransferase
MLALLVIACLIIGYLLGSIPTSYLIGRYWGKVNLLEQGESHVSATAVFREIGWAPFIIVIAGDLVKGMLALYICQVITGGNMWILVATAVAATGGHCWSVYIKFHGGLGAIIIFGMLFYTAIYFGKTHIPWEFALGGLAAAITMLTVKKSTLGTVLWAVVISVILLIELLAFNTGTLQMVLLPLFLLVVQFAKLKLTRRRDGDVYKNELISDLKRVNKSGAK